MDNRDHRPESASQTQAKPDGGLLKIPPASISPPKVVVAVSATSKTVPSNFFMYAPFKSLVNLLTV